ncbi:MULTISPECIES: DUF4142 domain-containing protein [unclassified Caballeronia]|uniref:DUF4142 domain-containing protein n=1 Tax=unclassified Caballeronia TaxID=2646786 RepID=UPI002861C5A7|nr:MULTISPECIES: DUF4142 domain-containing protein [unclassified Caballeronia]MDR5741253.1 DUF4142 domain-containing protein [Caballeronia sp. LZ016]MDR5807151.1 DUF4142 domain-containing protein [Caballeronia sp. LZ019]
MKHLSLVAVMLLLIAANLHAHAQGTRLTDAQMAGVFIVANQVEMAVGQLALRRTQSLSIQNYARRMIAEHDGMNRQMAAMLDRLGERAQSSAMSESMARQLRDDLAALDDVQSRDFDLAYLEHEIGWHQRSIAAFDGFIRTTTSADVKALLAASRPACILHLDQARRLEWALGR